VNGVAGAARDAGLSARIAAAALTSWVLPERFWLPVTHAIGCAAAGVGSGPPSLPFDPALAGGDAGAARSIAIERIASGHAARLWGLREYLRPGRNPPIDVAGMAHIESALAAKGGAILWVGRFTWASIITKIGLHQAGCAVTHLSRPTHGFGTSPFAVRRLNPIWTRIEERFLRERLVMEPGSETATLRALRRRLENNGLVSITVGDEGARTVAVPFLDGRLRLATGPMSLAAACGSPLLPVFTVREPTGRFLVGIEATLAVPADGARVGREERIAESYAARLEPWVRRYPGQWLA